MKILRKVSNLFLEAMEWMFPVPAQLSSLQVSNWNSHQDTFPTVGKYISQVDKVMTQVDKITEDIDQMPVAAFIFRDQESDEVQFSRDIRWTV